jgi:hypothetical protein
MYVHSPPSSVVADLVVVYNFRPAVDAGALVGLLMMPPPPGGRGGGGRRSKVEGGGKDEGENGEDAPPSATNRLPIAVGGWIWRGWGGGDDGYTGAVDVDDAAATDGEDNDVAIGGDLRNDDGTAAMEAVGEADTTIATTMAEGGDDVLAPAPPSTHPLRAAPTTTSDNDDEDNGAMNEEVDNGTMMTTTSTTSRAGGGQRREALGDVTQMHHRRQSRRRRR